MVFGRAHPRGAAVSATHACAPSGAAVWASAHPSPSPRPCSCRLRLPPASAQLPAGGAAPPAKRHRRSANRVHVRVRGAVSETLKAVSESAPADHRARAPPRYGDRKLSETV
eukprot:9443818-Pyramimonas_sp.AAC.2